MFRRFIDLLLYNRTSTENLAITKHLRITVIFCYPLKLSFHLAYPCRPLFCRLTQAFEPFLDFGIRGLVILGDQVKVMASSRASAKSSKYNRNATARSMWQGSCDSLPTTKRTGALDWVGRERTEVVDRPHLVLADACPQPQSWQGRRHEVFRLSRSSGW